MKSITQVMQNLVKPYIDTKDKAYAANIAPVEVSPAEAAHTAGTQLIYNGVLYDVTADIAINDDLATEGAGANISAANKVTEQISSVNEALSNEVEARATLGAHNLANLSLETIKSLNTNGTWSNNKWISPGGVCEFTVNTDTKGRVTSIIADVKSVFEYNISIVLGYGDFGNADIKTDVNPTVNGYTISYGDTDTNFSFQYLGASGMLRIVVAANTPISTKTMYPMIRLATDPCTDFTPYAMTNRELTDEVKALNPLSIYDTTNSSPFDAVKSAWSDITSGIHIGTVRTTQYSWGAVVYKFSAQYGNVLVFGYGDANIHMFRLSNGTWTETSIQ